MISVSDKTGVVEFAKGLRALGWEVIATGGIARFVIPMCRRKIHYDKDLLLKGLLRLYENNKRPGGLS